MSELAALVVFAFVGSVSPGPNNTVLWASGLRFGFRRTVPHVLGTAAGIALLAIAAAAGVGTLLEAMPAAEVGMKVIGSVYLLYVAFRVAGSGGVGRSDVSRPLTLVQGMLFQWVNPKAWVFALAAVGTFLPRSLPRPIGVSLLTGVVATIVVASSAIWASGGAALGRLLDDERTRRVVGIALAVLLVASVALIWI